MKYKIGVVGVFFIKGEVVFGEFRYILEKWFGLVRICVVSVFFIRLYFFMVIRFIRMFLILLKEFFLRFLESFFLK